MAKQPETILKEHILADLAKLPNCHAEKIQQVSIRGTPDVIACINGTYVALELKRDEKQKPDPLQAHKLNKVRDAGGEAFVVHPLNWTGVYAILTKMAYINTP